MQVSADPVADLAATFAAGELRETWQARALIVSKNRHIGIVLLSVLAHTFDDAMPVLLGVCFPGFTSITPPFLCSAGKVGKFGQIVADVVNRDQTITKDASLYFNEIEMRDDFRRLADQLGLSDADRIEMFKCVQRWVVADRRLDPTFDPQDPDAKRLVN